MWWKKSSELLLPDPVSPINKSVKGYLKLKLRPSIAWQEQNTFWMNNTHTVECEIKDCITYLFYSWMTSSGHMKLMQYEWQLKQYTGHLKKYTFKKTGKKWESSILISIYMMCNEREKCCQDLF